MRRSVVIAGVVVVALTLAAVTTTLALTLRPKKPAAKPAPKLAPPPRAVQTVPKTFIMVPQPFANSTVPAAAYPSAVTPVVVVTPVPYVADPPKAAPPAKPVKPKPQPDKPKPIKPKPRPDKPQPDKPQPDKPQPDKPSKKPAAQGTGLPISPSMFAKGQRPWGTTKLSGAEKLSWPAAGQLKVTFPANRCASDGGILGYATPPGLLPARAATLSYRVFFSETYDFRSGGKLPGFKAGTDTASGGNWSPGGASFRVMWRTDGAATAYVYYAKPDSTDKNSVADQDASYARIAVPTGTAGHSVWQEGKVADALPRFKRGAWNDISISMRLNAPGRSDGAMVMTVNGVSKSFGSMKWLLGGGDVQSVALDSWYGGSGSDCDKWAPKSPQVLVFQDFTLRRDA